MLRRFNQFIELCCSIYKDYMVPVDSTSAYRQVYLLSLKFNLVCLYYIPRTKCYVRLLVLMPRRAECRL